MKDHSEKRRHVDLFVQRLAEAQFGLHAYIAYLLGNATDAYDVLQEVNVILWQKVNAYDTERPFLNWARTIAYYQALKFRKTRSRDRLVFDGDLLEKVAVRAAEEPEHHRLLDKMDGCFELLTAEQQCVMREKYEEGKTLETIAGECHCSSAAVAMLLMRIRRALAQCIRDALEREAAT